MTRKFLFYILFTLLPCCAYSKVPSLRQALNWMNKNTTYQYMRSQLNNLGFDRMEKDYARKYEYYFYNTDDCIFIVITMGVNTVDKISYRFMENRIEAHNMLLQLKREAKVESEVKTDKYGSIHEVFKINGYIADYQISKDGYSFFDLSRPLW